MKDKRRLRTVQIVSVEHEPLADFSDEQVRKNVHTEFEAAERDLLQDMAEAINRPGIKETK